MLDQNHHYPLYGSQNTRLFYENILKETQSVDFEHFFVGGETASRHAPFSFSKAYFKNMLSSSEWGLDPNKSRPMTNYPHQNYSYWDYKLAWFNCFLYDNPMHRHTWFFRFGPDFGNTELPNWSYEWWLRIGPEASILPKNLYQIFLEFKTHYPAFQGKEFITLSYPLFKFFNRYQIPWIWTWQYGTKFQADFNHGLPALMRQYKYKWWQKFDYSRIEHIAMDQIHHWENNAKNALKAKEKLEIHTPLKSLKDSLKKKFPNATKAEIQSKLLELAFPSSDEEEDEKDDVSMTAKTIDSDDETPEEFHQQVQTILHQEDFPEMDTQPDFMQRIALMEQKVKLLKDKAKASKTND